MSKRVPTVHLIRVDDATYHRLERAAKTSRRSVSNYVAWISLTRGYPIGYRPDEEGL